VQRIRMGILLTVAAASLAGACGGGDETGALDGVDAIVFLQRPKRNETGDIFQYASYKPTARIVKLSPPTADGQLTTLCCDQAGAELANIDISSYDLSFDAREIVFSGKLADNQSYGLFVLHLDDGSVQQLATNMNRDYTYPVFLPGGKILFMSNAVVEEGAPQHRDEYERGVTLQLGVINKDGTNEVLGPRNLSHRVFPTVMSSGQVLATQWDHLGDMNEGHLMLFNPDLTRAREAYGKEGTGVANSYLKAREISPGRVIAIATARDRTVQSGALVDIRLGEAYQDGDAVKADRNMSEATASYRLLTPDVPLGREPSFQGVGRYYDAFPLNAKEKPDLLVSWADGPVESSVLAAAGLDADFGIYLFDSARRGRRPIFNDPEMWDVMPRPLQTRQEVPNLPPIGQDEQIPAGATLIGSMDVYKSSLLTFEPRSIFGVRVIEGFSGEEGIGEDFGLTEHEGAAVLGVAPVKEDGSWAALVPANIPIHLQAIDKFGMSLKNEPVWFSGARGESRFCGGCHEKRTAPVTIQPGLTQAMTEGPSILRAADTRAQRRSNNYTRDGAIGIPWDQALQPIFNNFCVSCHNGTPGAANPTWTVSDPDTGLSVSWTFDLRAGDVDLTIGNEVLSGYSRSHLSLMGPSMVDLEEAGLVISGNFPEGGYVRPGDARGSLLLQKLNPIQQYPTPDPAVRAFATPPHVAGLQPNDYYLLTVMADAGGQFYSRENAPGAVAQQ